MLRVRQKVSAVAVTQQTVKNCDFAPKSQNYIPQNFSERNYNRQNTFRNFFLIGTNRKNKCHKKFLFAWLWTYIQKFIKETFYKHDFINIIFVSFLLFFHFLIALNCFRGMAIPPKNLINCFIYRQLKNTER